MLADARDAPLVQAVPRSHNREPLVLEDTHVVVGEEEEARRCPNNREAAVAVEHRIHNSDNSNHNIAAHNGFDALDCRDVQGAVVEEVVVHVEVEVEAESHAHGGVHVEEEDTELRA